MGLLKSSIDDKRNLSATPRLSCYRIPLTPFALQIGDLRHMDIDNAFRIARAVTFGIL